MFHRSVGPWLFGIVLIATLALVVQAAPPNSSARCSVQYDGQVVSGLPGFSITGSGVQPNEEVAVSLETEYTGGQTYGTYLLTSQLDGTFAVHGTVYVPGTYTASVTLHRYSKPVATCSAVL